MQDVSSCKEIVKRFNEEVIAQGRKDVFDELMDPEFINHSAPTANKGPDSMWNTFHNILRPAFPDLKVIIHDQVAEGKMVTTRKSIVGTHLGPLMGIAPTRKPISIEVIDIVRVKDGKYAEHWGMNNFPSVIEELRQV